MGNSIKHIIDKETFYQIMKNVSASSYFFCTKCQATKIDATELLKFIETYSYNHDYDYDELSEIKYDLLEFVSGELFCYELLGTPHSMDDILGVESENFFDQESLLKWHIENKKRLFGLDEDSRLQYLVYDSVIFYQNIECECFLKNNIDQGSVYSVEVV